MSDPAKLKTPYRAIHVKLDTGGWGSVGEPPIDRREVIVMTVVGIHAMVRRPGCAPYICHIKELETE